LVTQPESSDLEEQIRRLSPCTEDRHALHLQKRQQLGRVSEGELGELIERRIALDKRDATLHGFAYCNGGTQPGYGLESEGGRLVP
jgi:hypothetical protein